MNPKSASERVEGRGLQNTMLSIRPSSIQRTTGFPHGARRQVIPYFLVDAHKVSIKNHVTIILSLMEEGESAYPKLLEPINVMIMDNILRKESIQRGVA